MQAAQEKGLDLVEVAPDAQPPVCRIMDYGKLRYEKTKKGKSKSRATHLKEIKLRPFIAEHDIEVKVKNIRKFLENGDRIKIHIIFRGREISNTGMGFNLIQDIIERIKDIGSVESPPRMEARNISTLIVPK